MKINLKKCSFVFLAFVSLHAKAERPMRGTYTVPVASELSAYNSYPVQFKSDNYEEQPNSIRFPLPDILMGEQVWVEFARTSQGADTFTGPNGSGKCTKIGRELQCQFQFVNIKPDMNKVDGILNKMNFTDVEKVARKEVSSQFEREPIGVLTYRLRGRN